MMLDVKIGDTVQRNMCGAIMELIVTEVTDIVIKCGDWQFNRETGGEIDEDLEWDGVNRFGSFIGKQPGLENVKRPTFRIPL